MLDYVRHFTCNTEADVKTLPICCVGSKAVVAETGNRYVLSVDKKWELKDNVIGTGGVGGSSGSGHSHNNKAVLDTITGFKTVNGASVLGSGNIEVIGQGGESLYAQAKKYISRFHHQYMVNAEKTDAVDIILFAGQSNSCGRATLADCTTDEDLILSVPMAKAFTFNNTAETEPVQIVEPISANGSSAYGYIPAFLNAYYATTGRRACACYKSSGGTMLNKFAPFVLDSTTGEPTATQGAFYKAMVAAIEHAKTNLVTNDYTVGDIFLVWCQGESDGDYLGNTNSYANAYEATLTTDEQKISYYKERFADLVEHLKEDTGLSTAFIIRIGHKSGNNTSYAPIIEAQNQLGKENDSCVLVSTIFAGAKAFIKEDGSVRNLMRDGWHYRPEGYVRAGLEAGVNAGIFINSGKKVKPILLEYHTLVNDDTTVYERPVDKFLYDPCRVDLNLMKKLASDTITSISMNTTSVTLAVDSTTQLTATVYPTTASNKNVLYESSKEEIATVDDNGLVTAVAEGSAVITVKSEANPDITATVAIEVSAKVVAVTGVTISQTEAALFVGDTLQLTASVVPENATNTGVSWKSSDNATATVDDNGLVTVLEQGEVTITATADGDSSIGASCAISAAYNTTVTLLDLDFVNHTVQEYIDDGVVSLGDSTANALTYGEDGLICNDTDLRYGLKLVNPIDASGAWTVELTAKVKAFDDSGTTATDSNYQYWSVLSGVDADTDGHTDGSTCLAPCFNDFKLTGQLRLITLNSTGKNISQLFVHDGVEHTYKVTKDADGAIVAYRDGAKIGTATFADASGYFGYILGIHKGYSYAMQYATETGITIKSLKVTA